MYTYVHSSCIHKHTLMYALYIQLEMADIQRSLSNKCLLTSLTCFRLRGGRFNSLSCCCNSSSSIFFLSTSGMMSSQSFTGQEEKQQFSENMIKINIKQTTMTKLQLFSKIQHQ